MANTNETIADIIAEKRRRAEAIERDCAEKMKRGEMVSDRYARELVADIRREADRLESAHKREKAAIEADALAVGGIVATTAEKPSAVGDCAKLREAVKAVVDVGYPHNFQHEAPHISGYCYDITKAIKKCFDALTAPPRNCDRFTTAEEAAEAWHKHEANYTGEEYCAGCPFDLGKDCARNGVCAIGWLFAKTKGGAK